MNEISLPNYRLQLTARFLFAERPQLKQSVSWTIIKLRI